MEIVNILFRAFFLGFTAWTFFWLLGKPDLIYGFDRATIDRMALRSISFVGIYHIISLTIGALEYSQEGALQPNALVFSRATGPYWFGFWMYPMTYFFLTQFYWFRPLADSKIFRAFSAVVIFIVVNMERFIILMTTFQRDANIQVKFLLFAVVDWITLTGIYIIMMYSLLKIVTLIFRRPQKEESRH